jgi:filamentous hemagglutinin
MQALSWVGGFSAMVRGRGLSGINTKSLPNQGASSALENQYKNLYSSGSAPYCTDYALNIRSAAGGEGKVVIFSGKDARWTNNYDWGMGSGDFRVTTSQGIEEFSYHSVYTDGRYIFDPFVSEKPIPQSNYVNMLKEANPNGVSWRIYEPETLNPDLPQLRRGGY